MVATILPVNAIQDVTWSIVPGTGTATISTTGLVTGTTDGTVWAKAVSVADITKMDSLQITISNQVVAVTSISVTTQNNVPASITTNGGTLQMVATILPVNAIQDVTWSIVPGTGTATISTTGLVTASTNGTVWVKAVSFADATKMDSLLIPISGQGSSTAITAIKEVYGLQAYPNPAQETLIIQCAQVHPALNIAITDVYGRLVVHLEVSANRLLQPQKINMSKLPQGIYILTIRDEHGEFIKKIIKQ
jgi:sorbitol-specific phosphotransferase system component IIA